MLGRLMPALSKVTVSCWKNVVPVPATWKLRVTLRSQRLLWVPTHLRFCAGPPTASTCAAMTPPPRSFKENCDRNGELTVPEVVLVEPEPPPKPILAPV